MLAVVVMLSLVLHATTAQNTPVPPSTTTNSKTVFPCSEDSYYITYSGTMPTVRRAASLLLLHGGGGGGGGDDRWWWW